MLTRRYFLKSSAIAVAGFGLAPSWLTRTATAQGTAPAAARRKVLIAIFQRGAADGLNIVVPYSEQRYYDLRPTIAIPRPGENNGTINLDGQFGLHPSLQPLKALWDNKQLAIVHAAGSPDPNRSHFEAQDFMESGTPGSVSEDGWMNRAMPAAGPSPSPLRAIAIGEKMPRTLRGERASAVAIGDLQKFQVQEAKETGIFESMYATAPDSALRQQGKETFEAMHMIEAINKAPYTPANGAQYVGEFGKNLQQIAKLIKANAGVECAFADIGNWDHHSNEAPQLANLLREYGGSLAAFSKDMGERMQDVVLVTMSEFGRTAREDGNNGTDHGHGNVMMVLGGPVRGGRVYGHWPGLEDDQLYEGRDLAVTTDFRDVLGELVRGHLNQPSERVFPRYQPGEPLNLLPG